MMNGLECVNPFNDFPPLRDIDTPSRTYSIISRDSVSSIFENIVMIPVEGEGFVVIKHEING